MSKFHAFIYSIATPSLISSLQKSEFLKLIVLFFHYCWRQNWNEWPKLIGKNTYVIFSTFSSKINMFGQKKLEINKEFQKSKSCVQSFSNISHGKSK